MAIETASHALMGAPAVGFNVIGHLSSSAGLGNTARVFIELLRAKGLAVAGLDIEAFAKEESPNLDPGMLFDDARALPFDRNLIVVALDRLPKLWLRHAKTLAEPRFRNAGLIFWELPVMPPAWIPALRMFDVMLACSHYVRQTLETEMPEVPTLYAEHPLRRLEPGTAQQREATRVKYGIAPHTMAFCCVFDPRSGLARKNPLGAVEAWLEAFPTRDDVCLVVKVHGEPVGDDPEVRAMLDHRERDRRILWITERFDHDELMRLFDACDAFISLHRAEGLGLVPMEAMSLGKLVIATGYSGTLTFMNEQNSLPVPYRLVEPRDDRLFLSRSFAGPRASWADPDLAEAALRMRWSAENRASSGRLAEQARRDIEGRQRTAWEGTFLDGACRLMNDSERPALRNRIKWQMRAREIMTPALLQKNVRAALRR